MRHCTISASRLPCEAQIALQFNFTDCFNGFVELQTPDASEGFKERPRSLRTTLQSSNTTPFLRNFQNQRVKHEGAVSTAFENLLTHLAKQRGWIFIPLLSLKTGKRLVPDGTLRDRNGLPRGYWEAKDTQDDLDTEIKKKTTRGYPLSNIIFEDTQTGGPFPEKQKSCAFILPTPRAGRAFSTSSSPTPSRILRALKKRWTNSRSACPNSQGPGGEDPRGAQDQHAVPGRL